MFRVLVHPNEDEEVKIRKTMHVESMMIREKIKEENIINEEK